MTTRTPETLSTRFLEEDYESMARIDETLMRSRKVIQDSIDLTLRTQRRKQNLENKLERSFEYFPREQDIVPKSSKSSAENAYNQNSFFIENRIDESSYNSDMSAERPDLLNNERIAFEAKLKELTHVLRRETEVKLTNEKELRVLHIKCKEMEENEMKLKNQLKHLIEQLKSEMKLKEDNNDKEESLVIEIEMLKRQNEKIRSELNQKDEDLKDISSKLNSFSNSENYEIIIEEMKETHKIETQKLKEDINELLKQKTLFELRYNNLYILHSQSSDFDAESLEESDQNTIEIEQEIQSLADKNRKLAQKLKDQDGKKIEILENHLESLDEKLQYQIKANKDLKQEIKLIYERQTPDLDKKNSDLMTNASKINDLERKMREILEKYEKLKSSLLHKDHRSSSVPNLKILDTNKNQKVTIPKINLKPIKSFAKRKSSTKPKGKQNR